MYSVKELCGTNEAEESFKSSDPNGFLIFTNDPNYETVQLWNKLNNTVLVNSFEECEHYVIGGWNSTQSLNIEYLSQGIILTILTSFLVIKKIKSRFNYAK
tara:strand:+ start:658 stop:960 length:303 start_codon:yes stop_codon:yes gene_type:complete